ncbi:8975_t:CDS:2 [Scutellospora calospora]|uniref:8975_t:CDS:1 n=1 Tax=Scutellospora calospora TaxID=85575 RepID=A0ACA9K3L7_9GLOM|nr:8975_t:CDS:2 [Scutellospora calospora]
MSEINDKMSYKRQRVSKACDSCRRKKIKCGGAPPVCSNCLAFNLNCTYNDTTKKRGPPKGYIEAIESRLYKMESLMGELVHSNDPRAETILAELMKDDLHPLHKARKVNYAARRNRASSFDDTLETRSIESLTDSSTNTNDNDETNFINDIMGIFCIDDKNQASYFGRSSGLHLLKYSDQYKYGFLSLNNTVSSNQNLVLRPELTEMPSQELSNHLLELYFNHVHPFYPIIYKPRFFKLLNDHEHPPYLLLNSMYSLASKFSDRLEVRKDQKDQLTAGDLFFSRAKALLDNCYDKAHATTIQALLLLSIREHGSGKTTRAWIYTGMAAKMTQCLGMHRNEKLRSVTLSHGEKEEQKRIFWACYVLERIPSVHFGRPLAINEKDIDAAYPSEEDDEYESLPFKMEQASSLFSINNNATTQTNEEYKEPKENQGHVISRFNCLIKLCEIIGRILQNVYTIKCNQSSVNDSVISILESSLRTWFLTLPPHLQYTSLDQHSDNLNVSTLSLHVLYYESLMLLHRPYAIENNSSHKICTSSAEVISNIVDSMFRQNILRNTLPVVVYITFITSIIHTCNASQSDTTISQPAKTSLAKCIRALESLNDIWMTPEKYINLLIGLVEIKGLQLDTNLESLSDRAESSRDLKKRNNFSNNQLSSLDSVGRQARFRAHVPPSDPFTAYQRPSSVTNRNNPAIDSSPPFTFNQAQPSRNLRHNFQESAQMYNSLGFRNMPTTTNISSSDPFAAQGVVSTSNGVGFWNIPQSANFEDWSYVHTQQVQQGVTLPSQTTLSPPMTSQPLLWE